MFSKMFAIAFAVVVAFNIVGPTSAFADGSQRTIAAAHESHTPSRKHFKLRGGYKKQVKIILKRKYKGKGKSQCQKVRVKTCRWMKPRKRICRYVRTSKGYKKSHCYWPSPKKVCKYQKVCKPRFSRR